MPQRKVTYRLYPSTARAAVLEVFLALYCRVYNALLEEHRRRYDAGEPRFTFTAMCRALTQWRQRSEALGGLNAQSLQVVARRAALAFDAFFRRLARGETPGYPRFKALPRFSGWGYKAHGDGWKLIGEKTRYRKGKAVAHGYSAVRISGVGTLPMRGKGRFPGTPVTAEVMKKGRHWYLSVTFAVEDVDLAREGGRESTAFDWGLTTLLTQVSGDPLTGDIEMVDNPRWLRKQLEKLAAVQREIAAREAAVKKASGRTENFPVNGKLQQAYDRLRALHRKLARQRQDFYHQLSAALVRRFGLIVTEELNLTNMVKAPAPRPNGDGTFAPNGAVAKSGLALSILDAAPAGLFQKLRYKAEEAGTRFQFIPTKLVKPTKRCCRCGKLHEMKLAERVMRCSCGPPVERDENAARNMLRYAFEGVWWGNEVSRAGTAQVAGALAPA